MRLVRFAALPLLALGAACLGATNAPAQLPQIANVPPPPIPAGALALGTPRTGAGNEIWTSFGDQIVLRNVSEATVTPVFPAPGTANGAAIIVAPGGAYMMLSMQREGWDIAHWLAARGITAFVLKYRLDETPVDSKPFATKLTATLVAAMTGQSNPADLAPRKPAVDDAIAAMHLVRARASGWSIDPKRIGFMGFSAGAITALGLVAADAPGAQPDFVMPIYPPMQSLAVPSDAPPMFVAIAADDPLFGGKGTGLIDSWQSAKKPVEMHLFERGSHGFGVGAPGTTSTHWLDELMWWLEARKLIPTPGAASSEHQSK